MKGLLALRCSGCFRPFSFSCPRVSFSRHFNTRGQYVKHIHLIAINVFLEKFN